MKSLKIGICGWGNVATGLFKTINQNKELIKSKGKLDIEISVIGARRDNPKCNPGKIEIVRDIFDVLDKEIDVVVELNNYINFFIKNIKNISNNFNLSWITFWIISSCSNN